MTTKEEKNETEESPGRISFYVILLAVIILLSIFVSQAGQPTEIPLSQVISEIDSGKIATIKVAGYTLEITEVKVGDAAAVTYSKTISPMWMSRFD